MCGREIFTISAPFFLNKLIVSSQTLTISELRPSTLYSVGRPIFFPLISKLRKSRYLGIGFLELVESFSS